MGSVVTLSIEATDGAARAGVIVYAARCRHDTRLHACGDAGECEGAHQ